jgi:hypothetical protein
MTEPIKMRVTPHFSLILDAEDGTEPRKWTLCYTYRAIAKIEDAIGKDIKKVESWRDLSSGKDFPAIVWGGLSKYNPEVTLEEVQDVLNPEAQRLLSDAIFELMFPGVLDAINTALKDEETGATASPNGQTGTTSTSNVPQIAG